MSSRSRKRKKSSPFVFSVLFILSLLCGIGTSDADDEPDTVITADDQAKNDKYSKVKLSTEDIFATEETLALSENETEENEFSEAQQNNNISEVTPTAPAPESADTIDTADSTVSPDVTSEPEVVQPEPVQEEAPEQSAQAAQDTSNDVMVWVDDTAARYHKKNGCGMDNAYQVTLDQAIAMGKTPCGRCYK